MRYNPFRPNGIAGPGMFSGRAEEIAAIEQALHQSKHGNPQHILIQGERGIGKSSLMLLARFAATGRISNDYTLNFIVVDVELGSTTTYREFSDRLALN